MDGGDFKGIANKLLENNRTRKKEPINESSARYGMTDGLWKLKSNDNIADLVRLKSERVAIEESMVKIKERSENT